MPIEISNAVQFSRHICIHVRMKVNWKRIVMRILSEPVLWMIIFSGWSGLKFANSQRRRQFDNVQRFYCEIHHSNVPNICLNDSNFVFTKCLSICSDRLEKNRINTKQLTQRSNARAHAHIAHIENSDDMCWFGSILCFASFYCLVSRNCCFPLLLHIYSFSTWHCINMQAFCCWLWYCLCLYYHIQ